MHRGLIVTVVLTLMVLAPRDLAAQEATPPSDFITPDPIECTVEPRSSESIAALASTPEPGTPAVYPPSIALATPGLQVPEGEPADEATVEAVTATLREVTACANAGDLRRVVALYTDISIRTNQRDEPLTAEEWLEKYPETAEPLDPEEFVSIRIEEVRVLPDGTVVAVQSSQLGLLGIFTYVYVLVPQGDRYLVDRVVDTRVEPVGTPPA